MDNLINSALQAICETNSIEFKSNFDASSKRDWCEIIKDIVAIANTEGGIIIFGVDSNGGLINTALSSIFALDPADITNKIYKYTGRQFSDFSIIQYKKDEHILPAIIISKLSIPLIFESPGTYDIGGGHQETAFNQGIIYFRHGAKSEPGNNEDINRIFENHLEEYRDEWLRKVQQVVEAPMGTMFVSIDSNDMKTISNGQTLQFVETPNGLPVFLSEEDIFKRYPLDFTRLVSLLKERYSNFIYNKEFHGIRKTLESNPQYCKIRYLNPHNLKSAQKRFYNPIIINEFDKFYSLKQNSTI